MRLFDLLEQADQNVWFHASTKKFDPTGLNPMSHLGTLKAALDRGQIQCMITSQYEFFVYSYRVVPSKPARIKDSADQHTAIRLADALYYRKPPFITKEERGEIIMARTEAKRIDLLSTIMTAKGFDSILYRNNVEDPGSTSMVIIDTALMQPVKVDRYSKDGRHLGEVVGELTERRIQNTELVYHGTSDRFIRGIIKQGLLANPPQRTYSGSDDDPEHGYETFGGVYVANNLRKAKAAASDAVRRFGGNPIIIVIQYVQGSGNLDEDLFTNGISSDIYHAIERYYEEAEESPETFEDWGSFSEYAEANRGEVLDSLVDSATHHFERFGRFGQPFLTTLRAAFNYALDHVEEDFINSNNMMMVLREHPQFVALIERLMKNLFPTEHRDAQDLAFQITRDIGFRGKTKIVRIQNWLGVPIWENPNVSAPV